MDEAPDNVTQLPYRRSSGVCNAQLNRGEGYCTNGAGEGTDHEGEGRCRLHLGDIGAMEESQEVTDLWRIAGLDVIINAAEAMRYSDQEYITEVRNNALVLAAAQAAAKLQDPTITPREFNDITNGLTRIDNLLEKYKQRAAVEEASNSGEAAEDEDEYARVINLARAKG